MEADRLERRGLQQCESARERLVENVDEGEKETEYCLTGYTELVSITTYSNLYIAEIDGKNSGTKIAT